MKLLVPGITLLLVFSARGLAQDGAPLNLDDHLARIEYERLHEEPVSTTFERPSTTPAEPMALTSSDTGVLTLSDVDPAIKDPQTPATTTDTEHISSQKRESYVRQSPLPSLWQTIKRDVKEAPCDLWRDTKRVYGNPVNLVILGSVYGGSLALQHGVDRSIEHHFNYNNDLKAPHHCFDEGWRRAFADVGNPGTHFAVAGLFYLIGQQRMDDKTYEVGKTLFSALAINGVTVMLGQAATYQRAPNGEYGTMPSGHTSSSFVVASVMDEAYGHVVGVPLYCLSALVGYERLDDREHYFSDVIMGGALGLVIGHSVASGRDPEFFGWKILPYASPGSGSGVAFLKTFK